MAVTLTKKTVTATVQIENKHKGAVILEKSAQEAVTIDPLASAPATSAGPWCEVGVDASYTHNLGNYQSAKIGVSIKVPCLHGEINAVFDFAKGWVDNRMNTLIEELANSSEA